jgi:hypothetical protein
LLDTYIFVKHPPLAEHFTFTHPEGTVEKVVLECKSLLLRFLSWFGNWISRTNSVREFQFPHEQDGFSTRPKVCGYNKAL